MNTKHYFVISGIIGGVIGSFLTALLVSPVIAQRDNFDTIQCSRLEVVDADGNAGVVLKIAEGGGVVTTLGKDGKSQASLGIAIFGPGGVVNVRDVDGELRASLSARGVTAFGKDQGSSVELGIGEHGGHVRAYGKGRAAAILGIYEEGGWVSTWDKGRAHENP